MLTKAIVAQFMQQSFMEVKASGAWSHIALTIRKQKVTTCLLLLCSNSHLCGTELPVQGMVSSIIKMGFHVSVNLRNP